MLLKWFGQPQTASLLSHIADPNPETTTSIPAASVFTTMTVMPLPALDAGRELHPAPDPIKILDWE